MKIAVFASEAAPFMKTGGLGDVIQALPGALAKIPDNEVLLMIPYYKQIADDKAFAVTQVAQFTVTLGWRQQYAGIYRLDWPANGVQVYFVDNLYYFGGRGGSAYGDGDDCERFAFFSKACLEALLRIDFIPDIIHCNDWQTALVPVLLQAQYGHYLPDTRCVFTIHNIE